MALALVATTTFGQGYLKVSSSANSQVLDGFTSAGTSVTSSKVSVALYWANGSSVASPFAALLATTPASGNSTTSEGYTVSQAWAALSAASGTWTLAVDGTANVGNNVIMTTTTRGAASYFAGGAFGIQGTSPSQNVTLIEVSWNSSGALGSATSIGWSSTLNYSLTDSLNTGVAPTTFNAFGTFTPAVAAVPEPSTMALAALGGASLLLFRRRK